MSVTTKRVVGLLAACLVAFVVVSIIDRLADSTVAFSGGSLPAGARLKSALEQGQIPFNALLLVLGGWLVASYIGGTVAYRLSGEAGPARLFAVIVTIAALFHLLESPHPAWMWIGGLAGAPLFALGAARQSITIRT